MNGYELSRIWFDWCFVNPDKISPNHSALYFFCIEHCNRLGWKDKFGLPTTMAMEAIGIKSYNTYKKTLTELVDFGFVKMVQLSKNQYSANIVALSNFNKAVDKALDKALIKHSTKQVKSTRQSNDSIDKQLTINKEPKEQLTIEARKKEFSATLAPFLDTFGKDLLNSFYYYWSEEEINKKNPKLRFELQKTWSLNGRLTTWKNRDKNFNKNGNKNTNTLKSNNGTYDAKDFGKL